MDAIEALKAARDAVKALIEAPFVADELGYGEREREMYECEHRQALLQSLDITDLFCGVCGTWYAPDASCGCENVEWDSSCIRE